jgi:hypothetical protein
MFIGVELVADGALEPAAREADRLVNQMREQGVLLSTDGPFHNVIKIKPPMCFDRANVRVCRRSRPPQPAHSQLAGRRSRRQTGHAPRKHAGTAATAAAGKTVGPR